MPRLKLPARNLSLPSLLLAPALLAIALAASQVQAMDYGIFDARALAMGGTAVAVGNTAQAQYYNPALLAFHAGDEDKSRDGRGYFPTMVVQYSDTAQDVANAVNDKLDVKVTDAVDAFNTQINTTTAAGVASAATDLRKVLDKIANRDINVDATLGFSLSDPSDHEGGAFYMNLRAFGVGTSKVTQTDLALLDEYIAATNQIAGGASYATVALQHPALVNPDGTLKDPTQDLTSSAAVSGLAIAEWGLAMAKEFTFWDQAVSLGITPKLMRVDAYRDDANFTNSNIGNLNDSLNDFSNTKSTYMTFNADLGAAAIFADHYRVSLAVKDAFAKDFVTTQGTDPVTGQARPDLVVKLHPRSRMGLGYVNDSISLGLDYDLKAPTPMANETASQYLSLGAEYRLFDSLALRAGYRQDRTGIHQNVSSAGLGYRWRRFVADLAYAQGGDMKGGGLQLGWTF